MKLLTILLSLLTLFTCDMSLAQSVQDQRQISVDLHRENGAMNMMFKECIGAGRANEGLRAD